MPRSIRPGVRTTLASALAFGPQLGRLIGRQTDAGCRRWRSVRAPLHSMASAAALDGLRSVPARTFDLASCHMLIRLAGLACRSLEEISIVRLRSRASLALFRAASPGADELWTGPELDEWPETIPAEARNDRRELPLRRPGRRSATRRLLLAVPPQEVEQWSLPVDARRAQRDARSRKDPRRPRPGAIASGQLLPAIYLATNPRQDTVSTEFFQAAAQNLPSSGTRESLSLWPLTTRWNRLEPRPRLVRPQRHAGREASRPALGLLTRQWQFGEFRAEDAAGSPAFVRLVGSASLQRLAKRR